MITKKLERVSKDYNKKVKDKLIDVYKDITGLDLEEFRKVVISDIDSKEAEIKEYNKNLGEGKRAKIFDKGYRSDAYIEEKTEEAFHIALDAYKKEKSIDIVFEEKFDENGNEILEFGVTKLIMKYVVPISLETDLSVGEIKKFILKD